MPPNRIVENPVINSPYEAPARHFRFDEGGITNEIEPGRRSSAYFVPIPQARSHAGGNGQMTLDSELQIEQFQQNPLINQIRDAVGKWRLGGYLGATATTKRLLDHWTHPARDKKLFFCQIEALETVIYLTEAARQFKDEWILNAIRESNEEANPGLLRMALKMATGSGKTVVMGMLIAWQVLNKIANPRNALYTDAFLVVAPGITIRDRLRVLLPSDPENYYKQRDLVPAYLMPALGSARIVVTNFQAMMPREKIAAGKLTKAMLGGGDTGAFVETPAQMVRRVCRDLGANRQILVINDEAHHCYRHKKREEKEDELRGEERKEAQKREEAARIWISGIEALRDHVGLKGVIDLSATPFFLRGSGYKEGTLFPWVVSDFSLIDAIECGIVKVPRVPVADNSMAGELPVYRNLWEYVRDKLPRQVVRRGNRLSGSDPMPVELQGAIHSLYDNYRKAHEQWEKGPAQRGAPPPVFIVVCNNTRVSKMVYDYVSGWEKPIGETETVPVPGALPLFSNVKDGQWLHRPVSILIDSVQLESGEAMSDDFKKIAAREIDEFKSDYRLRFPDRDVSKLTDEDLLREVMNTVGKPGRLGGEVKCVVSVSMLTEGWDANTVTHILGVRAFGTQLLCEQVVGRGLRRRSYETEKRILSVNGKDVEIEAFPAEYAEVYGVPFTFIPCSGVGDPIPPREMTRVKALPERIAGEIRFPRLQGYRYELPGDVLDATFKSTSRHMLDERRIPTKVEVAPIVGLTEIFTLDDLKLRRMQEVEFLLAKIVLETHFREINEQTGREEPRKTLFPQVLDITRRWLAECLECRGRTFPQMLLLQQEAHNAAACIHGAIVSSAPGEKRLLPILYPYDPEGSTRWVDFDTTRPVWNTRADKCHVSHVVADTKSWEQKVAQTLEDMEEVVSYAKNDHLGFLIPYAHDGREHVYLPDFIARVDDGSESADLLNVIVEVSGERRPDKAAKVKAARELWVPAVNNHGGFGRWAFVEITDPWNNPEAEIRALWQGELAGLAPKIGRG
jgi:type III restriction enzyme